MTSSRSSTRTARCATSRRSPTRSTGTPRELTADSLPTYFAYNAITAASLVAPIPLMIIHGTTDAALLPEFAQAAHQVAAEPKELVWIETHNHVELYDQEPYVPEAVGHAVRWLDAHVAT